MCDLFLETGIGPLHPFGSAYGRGEFEVEGCLLAACYVDAKQSAFYPSQATGAVFVIIELTVPVLTRTIFVVSGKALRAVTSAFGREVLEDRNEPRMQSMQGSYRAKSQKGLF